MIEWPQVAPSLCVQAIMRKRLGGLIIAAAAVASLATPAPGAAAPPLCEHGLLVIDESCLNPTTYQECDYRISVNYRQVSCTTDR